MQFTESFLSDNKADRAHNMTVSFKNCMLRIPGSINSTNGQAVQLLSRWDGCRPKINPLLEDFYIYLSSLRIKELTKGNESRNYNESYCQMMNLTTPIRKPSRTDTICNDSGCVTSEGTATSSQLGRLHEFCSESQSPRPNPDRIAECSVQPDDNAP